MIASTLTPLISVVMCVRDGLEYLSTAVESIQNQTVNDFEFIIIDDGSTDGSTQLLATYAKNDRRIRLIFQSNCGLTRSLNKGMNLANGAYIARMDADDIAHPSRFERQVAFLDAHPEVVCVGAGVELISEDGYHLGQRPHPRGHTEIRRHLLMGNGGAMTHPVIMFRRDVALRMGGYDVEFKTAQDLDLFLRFSEQGRVENLKETLLFWRQHPGSVNRTKSDTWCAMKTMAIKKTIDRIGSAMYAEQLFCSQQLFLFPSDKYSLAELAFENGRQVAALKLVVSELSKRSIQDRFSAASKLLWLVIRCSLKSGRTLIRKLHVTIFR